MEIYDVVFKENNANFGFIMLRLDYNRVALVIGFMLGGLVERTFHLFK